MTASHLLAYAAGALSALAVVAALAMLAARWWRRWTHRAALRVHRRFGARIDRFKFTNRASVVTALLDDAAIAAAVRAHAAEHGIPEGDAWLRVRGYLAEIVPQFSLWFYYDVGLAIADALLRLFYRVRVTDRAADAIEGLPRDAVVIYLMNHRSNADYVLAGQALAGQVALSYAVGEWARVFPLEYVFKLFGAYFVRRRFREPLYHAVLERYVGLIARNGVTQGIFPEGGLSRDGRFRPAKIGLLDYILAAAREPAAPRDVWIVPVAINYDRVLEDRSLLRELHSGEGHRPPGRVAQLAVVSWAVLWNGFRVITRSWKRHGDAMVVIGEPVPLAPWLEHLRARGRDLGALDRHDRLAEVQALADEAMRRVGAVMPVPAVPLTCAAIQSLGGDFLSRAHLVERVAELRATLAEDAPLAVVTDDPADALVDRAIELLWSRRAVSRGADGIVVLSRGRELVSYYANSIEHLLGDYAASVRSRDSLPVYEVVDL